MRVYGMMEYVGSRKIKHWYLGKSRFWDDPSTRWKPQIPFATWAGPSRSRRGVQSEVSKLRLGPRDLFFCRIVSDLMKQPWRIFFFKQSITCSTKCDCKGTIFFLCLMKQPWSCVKNMRILKLRSSFFRNEWDETQLQVPVPARLGIDQVGGLDPGGPLHSCQASHSRTGVLFPLILLMA